MTTPDPTAIVGALEALRANPAAALAEPPPIPDDVPVLLEVSRVSIAWLWSATCGPSLVGAGSYPRNLDLPIEDVLSLAVARVLPSVLARNIPVLHVSVSSAAAGVDMQQVLSFSSSDVQQFETDRVATLRRITEQLTSQLAGAP